MPSKKKVSTVIENLDFESAIAELTQIVEQMEAGNLSLENALKNFERGVTLTHQCQIEIQKAEQKVQLLIEKNGKSTLQTYQELSPQEDNS